MSTEDAALQDHPIASIFPLLSDAELAELAEDIKWNGVKVPIVIYQGKILDGRNRYRAARIAGAEYIPKDHYDGETPVEHVLSLNLRRRHLTESQRGMIAAKLANMANGGDRKSDQRSNSTSDISIEKASEMLNVGRTTTVACKSVLANAPEQVAAIESGERTVTEVKRDIKQREMPAAPADPAAEQLKAAGVLFDKLMPENRVRVTALYLSSLSADELTELSRHVNLQALAETATKP